MLKSFAIIALVLVCANCELLVTKEFVEELSRKATTWEVQDYEDSVFRGWTVEDFRNNMCGGDSSPEVEAATIADDEPEIGNLPTNFDARDRWGRCVHPIRVQGHCGSCWAFGTTEAMSDRFCIQGVDVILSPQDLLSCDKSNDACNGGIIMKALEYIEKNGCVAESCFPYVSAQGFLPVCPANQCPANGQKWVKYYCKPGSVRMITTIAEMKEEIYRNGPITTRFEHFADFNLYKSGVYQYQSGQYICGHVMKTIGWGKLDNLDYWILANTYGAMWGEKGFVKFKMHDCKIDNFMVSCLPQV